MNILAAVPTLDVGSDRLARLIRSMERLEGRERLHLVIVANTSERIVDAPVQGPEVDASILTTRIDTGLNLGFAGSVVLAAGRAPALHVWALQDDLELDPACLVELLAVLERDPALGAVSPTVVDGRGIVPRGSSGGLLDAAGRVSCTLPRSDVPTDALRIDSADFLKSRGMLIRREAWNEVGGMDPRMYPVGWTDVDLCARLRSTGWTFAAAPAARVAHLKGGSTPGPIARLTFERNGRRFRAKRAGGATPPEVHPEIPRELLEIVAQEASSLAFTLATRINLVFALRLTLRRWRRAVRRALGPLRQPRPRPRA